MPIAPNPNAILSRMPAWGAFTDYTPTMPKLYWDVYSQEQRIKAICEALDKVVAYANKMADELNISEDELEKLAALFEEFKESGFIDYYEQQLEEWINQNMPNIIKDAIKFVMFGLTSDGYFCAYIPDSWRDITFDTGAVYGSYTYGRLILHFDADGSGIISNTAPTVDGMVAQAVEDFEEAILNATY